MVSRDRLVVSRDRLVVSRDRLVVSWDRLGTGWCVLGQAGGVSGQTGGVSGQAGGASGQAGGVSGQVPRDRLVVSRDRLAVPRDGWWRCLQSPDAGFASVGASRRSVSVGTGAGWAAELSGGAGDGRSGPGSAQDRPCPRHAVQVGVIHNNRVPAYSYYGRLGERLLRRQRCIGS